MKYPTTAAVIASCLFSCLSCGHRIDRAQPLNTQPPSLPMPSSQSLHVPPGRCLIGAVVLESDTIIVPQKSSCTMRIDSILGYGSSFGMPLVVGAAVNVRIASLAAETLTTFGDARGIVRISAGQKIRGEIERNSVDDDGRSGLNFTMYNGVLIK